MVESSLVMVTVQEKILNSAGRNILTLFYKLAQMRIATSKRILDI